MKAVVIGPGRIGCGFAGQVLRASGFDVVFLARNPALVEHLNRVRHYRVCLNDKTGAKEVVVDGVRAVSTAASDRVIREIADADVIVTAVGAANLPDVAPLIAAGLAPGSSRSWAMRPRPSTSTGRICARRSRPSGA